MDGDQAKPAMQSRQVKELLAKQSKQRQKQKKQDESNRLHQEQAPSATTSIPLRHWPDDAAALTNPQGGFQFVLYMNLCAAVV